MEYIMHLSLAQQALAIFFFGMFHEQCVILLWGPTWQCSGVVPGMLLGFALHHYAKTMQHLESKLDLPHIKYPHIGDNSPAMAPFYLTSPFSENLFQL